MKRVVLALAALLMVPSFAFAVVDGQANINLLLTNFDVGFCGGPFAYIDEGNCSDLVAPAAAPGPAFLWVCVSHEGDFNGVPLGGISGAQWGIQYDPSVVIQAWFLCTGGFEIPDGPWPASGTGMSVAWPGGCYDSPGTVARTGILLLGAASGGPIGLVPLPTTQTTLWADCGDPSGTPGPVEYEICFDPNATGWPNKNHGGDNDLADGTGSEAICGDNCGGTPTVKTSWGAIKALF